MDKNKIMTVGNEIIDLMVARGLEEGEALLTLCTVASSMPRGGQRLSSADGINRVRATLDFLAGISRARDVSTNQQPRCQVEPPIPAQ